MKLFFIFTLLTLFSCTSSKITKEDKALLEQAKKYFKPLPASIINEKKSAKKIALGKELYFEKKLSINDTISCNSCHQLDNFGVDSEVTSPGHDGTRGGRNSPTSLNAALHFRQFWDGRAKDVEEQALGPILNPIEHGMKSEKDVITKLKAADYMQKFKAAGLKMTYKNIGVAIGAFERTLLTPSRFDDYLKGDINALSRSERKGLQKFINVGCTTCHSGVALGGDMYQKLGIVKKYPTKDTGRHEVTKKRRDKFKFKVPSLRNVTETAPYLHDGSISNLGDMIQVMAEYQLGKKLSSSDISDIEHFLESTKAKEQVKI